MNREFEGKKLLILGGVKTACSIVEKAKEMGAYVAVADYNTDSPAKQIADEAVLMDATDVKAIVLWCKENHIDGVTTGFIDILMPIVYEVCKELPAGVRVILCRMRGLESSRYSKLKPKQWKWRRTVTMHFEDHTEDVRRWAQTMDRRTFNTKLEDWYNDERRD